ncbi:MAG: hypothetical protein PHD48_09240 [Alphaproteobacteria bacterium]|nr:hypothetical protein [Alphaproteobacteria bacterium]
MSSRDKKHKGPQGATQISIDILPIIYKMFKNAGARDIKDMSIKNKPNTTLLTFVIGKKTASTSIDLLACAQAKNPEEFLQEQVTQAVTAHM